MWKATKTMFIGLLLLIMSTSAYGKDEQAAPSDWEFNLAPLYLWGMFMSGDMTAKGTKNIPVDVDFGDIVSNLSAVFTFHFEGVWKNQWGFLVDFSYVKLGGDQETPGPTIHVDFEDIMTEGAGYYRFSKGPHAVDALFGVRYTHLSPTIGVGSLPRQTDTQNWVDPIIGARYIWSISDKWKLNLRADIGGFGVGSNFTYNLGAIIDFKPWKHVSILGGYRVLYQDYEDGSGIDEFKYDVTMHGPLLALNFTW